MRNIFCECTSLISFPDIKKWNIPDYTNIRGIFCECIISLNIPTISE